MDPNILVLLALVTSIASIVVALLVVSVRDLVYASSLLAVLGGLTAALTAIIGYYLVAAFIIIVYVGAAVMFIIISISMLGGGGLETWNRGRGIIAALISLIILALAFSRINITQYAFPVSVDSSIVANSLLTHYAPLLAVLLVALAVTVLEALAVARRG
ncbi:MAG: NADH-quinone oxidoreductase subunit J [Acidilobaceae archaeon]